MSLHSKVLLIQMPFAAVSSPSLGLSLLKAGLAVKGINATVCYFNLQYAQLIGTELYEQIAAGAPNVCDLLGEWIFAEALWGPDPAADREYLQKIIKGDEKAHKKNFDPQLLNRCCEKAQEARLKVPAFLDQCISETNWQSTEIVGLTSVFQQHNASLAMAKRLKETFPHLFTIMGGANCEAEMGKTTFESFSFLDAVCSGEGDHAFPRFAELLLAGKQPRIEGILTRYNKDGSEKAPVLAQIVHSVPPVNNLDNLPYPNYEDYFKAVENRSGIDISKCRILFETSRGCWWGQKHHCTFCGLNGLGMAFRYKSSDRALSEIQHLVSLYGQFTNKFSAADNIIPLEYFQTLLPRLADLQLNLDLFYETKANLTEAQIIQYKQSGLSQIQPGIESLNSSVLKLMRKGVTALQNIQLLKWCAQYGIYPHWNYLFGFPGEHSDTYNDQAELLSSLRHLTPPQGSAPVRFDRFSPYHTDPSGFKIVDLSPYPAYKYVYRGLSPVSLSKLAYYFTGDFQGCLEFDSYVHDALQAVTEWHAVSNQVTLCHSTVPGEQSLVFDGRVPGSLQIYVLRGVYSRVFELCSSITTVRKMVCELQTIYNDKEVQEAVEKLIQAHLVILEESRLLNISIPLGFHYLPPDAALQDISTHLKQDGELAQNFEVHIPTGICTVMQ
jgi:ribosomal peptide maturation radical SAM protein 1